MEEILIGTEKVTLSERVFRSLTHENAKEVCTMQLYCPGLWTFVNIVVCTGLSEFVSIVCPSPKGEILVPHHVRIDK